MNPNQESEKAFFNNLRQEFDSELIAAFEERPPFDALHESTDTTEANLALIDTLAEQLQQIDADKTYAELEAVALKPISGEGDTQSIHLWRINTPPADDFPFSELFIDAIGLLYGVYRPDQAPKNVEPYTIVPLNPYELSERGLTAVRQCLNETVRTLRHLKKRGAF